MDPDITEVLHNCSDNLLFASARLKELGNNCFSRQEFRKAEERYSLALHLLDELAVKERPARPEELTPFPHTPLVVVLLSNRAECSLRQSHPAEALESIEEALTLDRFHEKSWCRKVRAHCALHQTHEARVALESVRDAEVKYQLEKMLSEHQNTAEGKSGGGTDTTMLGHDTTSCQ